MAEWEMNRTTRIIRTLCVACKRVKATRPDHLRQQDRITYAMSAEHVTKAGQCGSITRVLASHVVMAMLGIS